ncbi:MAG: BON domain-containing protein [Gemmatimonadota bacterium]|nr:BON domain-containing protein [Gemmatimonadota bacterium]
MADDYDNTDEIANLSDDELRTLVRTELRAQKAFDADDITVNVRDGRVSVSGRVGTDVELRVIDHVLTDLIGLKDPENLLVVDDIRRAESPEAIDEHLVDEDVHSGLLLGDSPGQHETEAEHLASDNDSDSGGTHDVTQAIEGAEPWIPPESPTPEGRDEPGSRRDAFD